MSYNWIGTEGFEVKSEAERFTAVCHVVVKTLNLVISRSSFDEYGREMFKNACRTCCTIILVRLTNNITTALWRCRCHSRRCFLNSLLSHGTKSTTLDGKRYTTASKTMRFQPAKWDFYLFWMSQCIACHPAGQILHHVTVSCKGPILPIIKTNGQLVFSKIRITIKSHFCTCF